MKFSPVSSLLMAAGSVSAFQDASPFMLFSTSELLFPSPGDITTSSRLLEPVKAQLTKCPSEFYVVAHQPGASSTDFGSEGATPHLRRRLQGKDDGVRSSVVVSEVVGNIEPSILQKVVEEACGAGSMQMDASTGLLNVVDDPKPRVIRVNLPGLPRGDERRTKLRENDLFLSTLIEMLPTSNYTVLYTTSAAAPGAASLAEEPTSYQMDHYMDPLVHTELKRDLGVNARAPNDTLILRDGPLFERYQFLTPAIFMGIVTMFFLLSIIFVAIRAIAGLEVSYGAFEKEMGPNAQKKAQ